MGAATKVRGVSTKLELLYEEVGRLLEKRETWRGCEVEVLSKVDQVLNHAARPLPAAENFVNRCSNKQKGLIVIFKLFICYLPLCAVALRLWYWHLPHLLIHLMSLLNAINIQQ